MDSLQAPLISNRDPEEDIDASLEDDGRFDHGALTNEAGKETSLGLFMWLLTLSAGISGLLFGCTFRDPYCFASLISTTTTTTCD